MYLRSAHLPVLGMLLACTPPTKKPDPVAFPQLHPEMAATLDQAFSSGMLLLYLYPDSLSFRYRAMVMPFATKRVLDHRMPDEVARTPRNVVFIYTGAGQLLPRSAAFYQRLHAFDAVLETESAHKYKVVFPEKTRHYRVEGTCLVEDSLPHPKPLIPLLEAPPKKEAHP
ncbi:hypothetical protein GCM10023185_27260 [Hymenobacter saemangeumensis]|uniref:Lipoprotein n=1 Tax=Hymenobacter saemangeumensis TaxID=1084522 RepID=A0ABP8IJA3_9BACT